MKITVDKGKCQNHGLCAISAPDHFELDADGKLTYQKTFGEEDLDAIEDAIDSCPLQAIVMDRDAA
ncbi:ferredoxin [Streptomyces sp. NPDC047071]|uniref:ferredoxin n=1 Tax=Streptomyces sp. NPDC047071 TaxID=3154808 RepID=UPI003451BCB4